MKQKRNLLIAAGLTIAVFIIDITTPIGYADWLLYFIPLFIAAGVLKRRSIPVLPALATVLIITGYFLSPPGGDPMRAVANRSLSILALWWVSLILMKRKQSEEALERSYQELETRVRERTEDLREMNAALRDEIAERRKAEEEIRSLSHKHELILEFAGEGILGVDVQGKITFVNKAGADMLGYRRDELVGKAAHETIHYARPDGTPYPEHECPVYRVRHAGNVHSGEEVFWRKDGSNFPADYKSIPVKENELNGAVITFRDITERKKMEEEIRHMAYHDALTGLPNRRLFLQIVNIEIAQARRHQSKLAVLFLDLDRFKDVNDTLGHDAGDQLLRQVAGRVRSTLRQSDSVARIGGDEFNLVLPDIDHPEYAAQVARKLLDRLGKPYMIGGRELTISASIGISIYPDDSEERDVLFRHADISMFRAKERGRNAYQFYNPEINIRSIERIKFESKLRQALARAELVVYYQPQVVSKTRRIVAAEALVRWKHPDFGLLDPAQFITAAESIGFITSIDAWVLKTACGQFRKWMDAGYDHLSVAVNVSSRMFQSENFVERISEALEETELPPDRLQIEITESVAMADIERTAALLKELAAKGVAVSIDDFGTGYSSLNYLKKLPFHRLKIDRSFVKDIAGDPEDRAIISAVTSMARKMSIRTVAEGVETEEQLSFLRASGCDEAQGFLFSRPLPPEEFRELLVAGKR